MRLDGTVAFMRLPFLESQLPSGKEWVRIDLTKAARLQGMDLTDIQSFAKGSDPRETLDYLRSVSGKLTRIGIEDVRGVPTTALLCGGRLEEGACAGGDGVRASRASSRSFRTCRVPSRASPSTCGSTRTTSFAA